MSKNIATLIVIALMVLSVFGFAYAAKPEGSGKGQGAGQGAGQGSGGGQGQGQGAGQGSGGGQGQGQGAAQGSGGGQDQGQSSGESDGITVGDLVSSVENVKRDQWKITKNELKAMGYHGSVSDFVTAFNKEINAQKKEIREKILAGDTDLTEAVVNETAERELARIRNETIQNLTVSDTDVLSSLIDLLRAEGIIDEDLADALQDEIIYMDSHFKKMIFTIATSGTDDEKRDLADQLKNLIE